MTQEEWDKKKEEEEDDERFRFRVLSMIMEAKRPNETAWQTLLTREAMYAMVEFEEFLYNITLEDNFLEAQAEA